MSRYGKLVGGGYVSRDAYEKTATDAAALRATVQSDKASVESAALDLSYCTVVAPISGRVGALNVDKGNMVKSADATVIVSIDTLSPIYVGFSVPEAHLPVIIEQMAQTTVPVSATPAGSASEKGLLTLVDNTVDTRTGTIRLRATFENSQRRLWPGQFVQVELPLGMAAGALTVPTRAVQSGREESYVYVVDKDSRASYRKVRPLFEYADRTVVDGAVAGRQNCGGWSGTAGSGPDGQNHELKILQMQTRAAHNGLIFAYFRAIPTGGQFFHMAAARSSASAMTQYCVKPEEKPDGTGIPFSQ